MTDTSWVGSEETDDGPWVCPDHLRFVPCRRCTRGQEKMSNDPDDVAAARAFQSGTHPPCSSTGHETVPATIEGEFDCSHVNGSEPARLPYCTRCAVALEFGGMFTPERALRRVDVETATASYDGKTLASLRDAGITTFEVLTRGGS